MEKEVFEGRVVKKGKIVIDDSTKRYEGISTDDFLLENLEEAGVQMQPVVMHLSAREISNVISNSQNK